MTKTFRPTLIPTLFTVPAVIILLILGSWQLLRLQEKNHLIEKFAEEIAKPALDWPIAHMTNESLEYRHITLNGIFLHDDEIFL